MFHRSEVSTQKKIVIDNKQTGDNSVHSDSSPSNSDNSKPVQTNGETKETGINYEKLFNAVSVAESGDCKSAVALRTNNCVSIMGWKSGKRYIRKFATIEDNKKAFIDLWKRVYKVIPNRKLAVKYTGNDSADTWLKAVLTHYYN